MYLVPLLGHDGQLPELPGHGLVALLLLQLLALARALPPHVVRQVARVRPVRADQLRVAEAGQRGVAQLASGTWGKSIINIKCLLFGLLV